MSEPIGVGIIGAGRIANLAHIPGYRGLPEKVRIVAFADVVGKVAEKVTKEHDIPMAFGNYDELLALEEVEAVSICTPPVAHRDATIAAPELSSGDSGGNRLLRDPCGLRGMPPWTLCVPGVGPSITCLVIVWNIGPFHCNATS